VQPGSIEMELTLSAPVAAAIDQVLLSVVEELRAWGVTPQRAA